MKKLILSITALSLLFASCGKTQDPFEVSKQHVGLLTDSTLVKNLKTVFINDSITEIFNDNGFMGVGKSIEVFDKAGKKLLILNPEYKSDTTAVVKSVQIIDPRYKTDKNITTKSTFKDINGSYKISRIDNLINSVVVSVNEINASFTIDKKELPANIRFDMNLDIEAMHIPDNAKIKYFFINW
ncbi:MULTISPECIES: hypothetical protein [Aestuariibaculum]|uniref:Uncharacterized protein n=1 Tax=Aestuariibaculum marinum TaxID=2683592 RepID=A0A8J6QD97_9FLAO|nr:MULTISPECIES: hypothetical protein [Aestuariibaculum]MBD0825021.1 hypothetical protein [Aestuariibaculum marinum]WMI64375.1 hypothetical protein RBH94_09905 [Aestuariibaculum sp. YM273]